MDIPKKADLFIKIEEYKDVIDIMGLIKEKINDIERVLNRIKEIKAREDSELASWKSSLEYTKTRIDEIDKNMLKLELP